MRTLRVGDEALVAVDNVIVAVADRGGAHHRGITAGVRFGLGKAGDLFARNHRKQVVLLLSLTELKQDRADFRAEHVRLARRKRDRPAHLFPDDHARQQAKPEPSIFRRRVDQPQPHLLGGAFQAFLHLGLQARPLIRVALGWDDFGIDEVTELLLQ